MSCASVTRFLSLRKLAQGPGGTLCSERHGGAGEPLLGPSKQQGASWPICGEFQKQRHDAPSGSAFAAMNSHSRKATGLLHLLATHGAWRQPGLHQESLPHEHSWQAARPPPSGAATSPLRAHVPGLLPRMEGVAARAPLLPRDSEARHRGSACPLPSQVAAWPHHTLQGFLQSTQPMYRPLRAQGPGAPVAITVSVRGISMHEPRRACGWENV